MKTKVFLIYLIVVGLAFCMLGAVVSLETTAVAADKSGDVITLSYNHDGDSLGWPPTMRFYISGVMGATAIESLLRYDESGNLAPFLATGWGVADDLKSITFTLRKGVKFHDGTDFNAEAAKWNLTMYNAEGFKYLRAIKSIDIIDDYTIRCNLSQFDNTIMGYLTQMAGMMVSPTAYKKHGKEWCEKNPVGTGPFKLVSRERDVKSVWERNENYWQEGKPYLKGIKWVVIADPMTKVASLKAGEIDVLLDVSSKDAKDLEASGKFNIRSSPTRTIFLSGDTGDPKSPFADIKVRQAMEHAIDKQAIVDNFFFGYSSASNQWVERVDPYYNPDVVGRPYNPQKAKELLAEAGYPDGFKTKLICINIPLFVDVFTAVHAYLKEVGIDAKFELVGKSKWLKIAIGGSWDGLLVVGTTKKVPGFDAVVKLLFGTGTKLLAEQAHYDDIDELMYAALRAPTYKEKLRLNHQLTKIFFDKYSHVTTVATQHQLIASRKGIKDLGLLENPASPMVWRPYSARIEKK